MARVIRLWNLKNVQASFQQLKSHAKNQVAMNPVNTVFDAKRLFSSNKPKSTPNKSDSTSNKSDSTPNKSDSKRNRKSDSMPSRNSSKAPIPIKSNSKRSRKADSEPNRKSSKPPTPIKEVQFTTWPIAPSSYLKFNTDGSVKGSKSSCGFASRVHGRYKTSGASSFGKLVSGGYRSLDDNTTIVETEGAAIKIAMLEGKKLIGESGLYLWIESDEKGIVGAINGHNSIDPKNQDMIWELQKLRREIEDILGVCKITWVRGEANGLAHILSRFGGDHDMDFPSLEALLDAIPEELKDLRTEVEEKLKTDASGTKYKFYGVVDDLWRIRKLLQ